ncbi:hypothetical protein [Streptomyces sp. NPDC018610]
MNLVTEAGKSLARLFGRHATKVGPGTDIDAGTGSPQAAERRRMG